MSILYWPGPFLLRPEISGELRVTMMLSLAGLAVGMKPVSNRCGDLLNVMVVRYSLQYYAACRASCDLAVSLSEVASDLLADPQEVFPLAKVALKTQAFGDLKP